MTETEWLACDDPAAMRPLLSEGTGRVPMLFSAACLRRVWHLVTDGRCRALIESTESHLDGLVTEEEVGQVFDAFESAYINGGLRNEGGGEIDQAVHDLAHVRFADAISAADHVAGAVGDASPSDEDTPAWESAVRAEKAAQARLLRDVVGNPFRPVILDETHRTPTVVSLARSTYDERHLPSGELDPHRLAVLADSLEEAGAPNELVAHLRSPGPHVRGCHVVDLCLGLS